jgi:hypothetical protein
VHRAYRELRHRLRFELEVGRLYAARRLAEVGQHAFDKNVARLACLNLIHAGQITNELVAAKEKQPGEKQPDAARSADPVGPLPVHPDVPPEEAERLVREMGA